MSATPAAVVFGARNVGRAIVADRLREGWGVVAVVNSDATASSLLDAHSDAEVIVGDAAAEPVVDQALARASRLGRLQLVANAITAPPRDDSFGGGPIAEAPEDRLSSWMDGFVPMAWQIMRRSSVALREAGGGTLIQVAGGSARRGFEGRGPWGAAQHAVKALIQSLSAEMRPHEVHAAMLILDGYVETERHPLGDDDPRTSIHPDDVAAAVAYLHSQTPRAWSHEMILTPALEPWTP